ncbi:MAG: 3-phosphoshikimate 1-carboxyvinyltransferase [Anaerolineae bacterium]|nr:3-phosphoshikimate 1-carboxyvinyltransferase [Anaerolineae bacterium]
MNLTIHPVKELFGTARVPGDKSISHRSAMFASLAEGESRVRNFLPGGDCLATLGVLRALGVTIDQPSPTELRIDGVGLHGWQEPAAPLDCVNSGTTMRLMAGLLAGQSFFSILHGSSQLIRRPMGRIVDPLRQMGATIYGRQDGRLAPLAIRGHLLSGIDYTLPVASAQVKSAILLAGLYSNGLAIVREPAPTRDHTERILTAMGAQVGKVGQVIASERPRRPLRPLDLTVPGDISSAAFLLAAGLLAPRGHVTLEGVGVNPTRTGILDIVQQMGGAVRIDNLREEAGEPAADLVVQPSQLHGVEIGGELIPRAIDELPVVAVLATQARGRTVVRNAAELRVKETDRIATIVAELRTLGARIEERPDGFVVEGPTELHSAPVSSHGDHRLAMALAVAGLAAEGPVLVEDTECIADSFPGFERVLTTLGAELTEDE